MKLQTEENRRGPLAMLKTWRDEKYKEIDQEYDLKVQEFNTKILEQEEKVSQTIAKIEDAINEDEASLDQIKQLQKDIEMMENEVNKLMAAEQGQISSGNNSAEWDLVNTYVQFGHHKYLVKGRVFCRNENFYALECERSLTLYDGLCPKCRSAHVPLHPNRGYYAPCQSIDEQVKKQREKLT
jgi:septal ring factor EnvC (AmiA/AmiB activator)